jgi:glycosyltransferase involved in cell wall biosynthesis
MHIVMLSDYETQGGAAVAASRLAEALCAAAQRVTRCVLYSDGKIHPWRTWPMKREPVTRLWRRFASRLVPGVSRAAPLPDPVVQLRGALRELRPDVINVHNLHGGATEGWGPELIAICADFAPVVWTLHDMWSFTGRCAYAYDCRKFITGCDATCPTPDEYPVLASADIADAWNRRRLLFHDGAELIAVTPSRWLAAEAQAGLWGKNRVVVIPYGVPTDQFRPLDRQKARRTLGFSERGPVVLVAAQYLTDRRKGAALLPHVLSKLRQRPLTLLAMGHGAVVASDPAMHVVSLGWMDDVEKQVLAYNAADVLLHPAPVDNFPNVVLEAMACGTPTVALPIGGLPELVRPSISGWLANNATASALASTLDLALDEIADGGDLRDSCRAMADQEFTMKRQAEAYLDLFSAKPQAAVSGAQYA